MSGQDGAPALSRHRKPAEVLPNSLNDATRWVHRPSPAPTGCLGPAVPARIDGPVRLFRFLRGNKRSLDNRFHNLKICRQAVACGQPSPCPSAAQYSPPSCRSRADVREGSSCPPTATRVSPLKARTWNRRSPPCGRLDAARSSKRRPAAAFDPPPFERQQRGRQRVAAKILNKAVGPGNAQT
jgi:hypothetical protein